MCKIRKRQDNDQSMHTNQYPKWNPHVGTVRVTIIVPRSNETSWVKLNNAPGMLPFKRFHAVVDRQKDWERESVCVYERERECSNSFSERQSLLHFHSLPNNLQRLIIRRLSILATSAGMFPDKSLWAVNHQRQPWVSMGGNPFMKKQMMTEHTYKVLVLWATLVDRLGLVSFPLAHCSLLQVHWNMNLMIEWEWERESKTHTNHWRRQQHLGQCQLLTHSQTSQVRHASNLCWQGPLKIQIRCGTQCQFC